jgi:hypothetical protein
VELRMGEDAGSNISALIDFGNAIYRDVRASQRTAQLFLPANVSTAPNMARALTAANAVNG